MTCASYLLKKIHVSNHGTLLARTESHGHTHLQGMMGNVVFPCIQLKIRVSITMEERTLDIGAHLAVSATMGQELINETCPPCVAPKCSFLEPVPTHNKLFTRLCWTVDKFVQCGDFLIVFFFFKRRTVHGNFCGTRWDASVHFCPPQIYGNSLFPRSTPGCLRPLRQRPGGCTFSRVLFLPQGPTLEARHTPPPGSLHGVSIGCMSRG